MHTSTGIFLLIFPKTKFFPRLCSETWILLDVLMNIYINGKLNNPRSISQYLLWERERERGITLLCKTTNYAELSKLKLETIRLWIKHTDHITNLKGLSSSPWRQSTLRMEVQQLQPANRVWNLVLCWTQHPGTGKEYSVKEITFWQNPNGEHFALF